MEGADVLGLYQSSVSHCESITLFQIKQTKFVSGNLCMRQPVSRSGQETIGIVRMTYNAEGRSYNHCCRPKAIN
jgi:hypothetical protein